MENYVGKRLDGRYEINEIIGVGGMAVVYKAYDNIDDRVVAVKILKEEFIANEEFRRRFKNESKAIAVLSHPNIVKVFDVSYGDKLQYIVMEYVEGITLKEYILQQGIINSKEAVFFVIQILRALQHAHDKGIVHRDIKPQNIMLLENGAIKVTDFGIARFSRSETRTMTDSTIGSVHYISPEQARGDFTDDKADIYSVGVMFYEMLTGRLPFESDNTVSVAIMQLQQDPVMPRKVNPDIPEGLEQIVMKAMQKNVLDRYQSAAEMLLDIEEFKRNPEIKFGYTYNNNEQTKYIPTVKDVEEEVYDDEEEQPRVKNRTIPILIGVLFALVAVVGVGIGVMAHLGYFTGTVKTKVPKFVGTVYSAEVFAKEYPDYTFAITEQVNADASPNEILSQDPAAGEKVDLKKTTINLVVAINDEMLEIPSGLKGSDFAAVVSKLTQAGLQIKEKEVSAEEYADSLSPGTVVDISPSEGTKVTKDTIVTVEYISYDETEVELVAVPDVSGISESSAKQVLTTSGFVVSTNYEYNNTIKTGYVISNTLAGAKVPKGSSITINVSRGVLVEQSVTIAVTLPKTAEQEKATVTVTLDGTIVDTKSNTPLDGSDYSFTVKGSESLSVVKVSIDGKVYYKCNINFTSTTPKPFNETNYKYGEEPAADDSEVKQLTVPKVFGLSLSDAQSVLSQMGFTNITTKEAKTYSDSRDAISMNDVVSSTPAEGSTVSSDTQIVLFYRGQNSVKS